MNTNFRVIWRNRIEDTLMYPDESVAGKSWQTRQLQLGLNIHRRHIRKFCDQSLNIVDKLSNLAFNQSRWPKETYGVAAVVMDVTPSKFCKRYIPAIRPIYSLSRRL